MRILRTIGSESTGGESFSYLCMRFDSWTLLGGLIWKAYICYNCYITVVQCLQRILMFSWAYDTSIIVQRQGEPPGSLSSDWTCQFRFENTENLEVSWISGGILCIHYFGFVKLKREAFLWNSNWTSLLHLGIQLLRLTPIFQVPSSKHKQR